MVIVNNYDIGTDVIPDDEKLVPGSDVSDAGKVLTVNAAGNPDWAEPAGELPTLTGNAGKVLTVNSGATGVEWSEIPEELPSLTGNAGKVLTVSDGAEGVEWATPSGGGGGTTVVTFTAVPDENNLNMVDHFECDTAVADIFALLEGDSDVKFMLKFWDNGEGIWAYASDFVYRYVYTDDPDTDLFYAYIETPVSLSPPTSTALWVNGNVIYYYHDSITGQDDLSQSYAEEFAYTVQRMG